MESIHSWRELSQEKTDSNNLVIVIKGYHRRQKAPCFPSGTFSICALKSQRCWQSACPEFSIRSTNVISRFSLGNWSHPQTGMIYTTDIVLKGLSVSFWSDFRTHVRRYTAHFLCPCDWVMRLPIAPERGWGPPKQDFFSLILHEDLLVLLWSQELHFHRRDSGCCCCWHGKIWIVLRANWAYLTSDKFNSEV